MIHEWKDASGNIEKRTPHSDLGGTMRLGGQDCVLDKNSNASPKVPTAEIKKASRAIQKLKDKRDELSRQLTEIGKP